MTRKKTEDTGHLYRRLSLGPELRNEEPKGKYPKGSIKKVFEVFGAEMSVLTRVNAWFLLFVAPLLLAVVLYPGFARAAAVAGFNFTGNVGMAYPGGSDRVSDGLLAVYAVYKNVLYLCLPAALILSVGVCGGFNCFKSLMWGEKTDKVTGLFFRGVKRHWWKYMLVFLFDALVVIAAGSMLIWFLELRAVGAAAAGHWVLLIAVFVAAFLLLYPNMQLLPMISEVDLKFTDAIKNSLIFSVKLAILGIPLFVVLLAPMGLFFVKGGMMKVLFAVLALMFVFPFYGLSFTAFSQTALDNILTPLYMMSVAPKAGKSGKKKAGKGGSAPSKPGPERPAADAKPEPPASRTAVHEAERPESPATGTPSGDSEKTAGKPEPEKTETPAVMAYRKNKSGGGRRGR